MSLKVKIASRYSHVTLNLWASYKALADKYAKVNLGLGAPDYNPPVELSEALTSVLEDAISDCKISAATHQYAPLVGHPELISALADVYTTEMSRKIRPEDGCLSVGIGAQGCIFNVINALVNPGDEVVIIDPHYDCYPSMVQAVGAKPVFVPLLPPKTSTDGATSVNANDWQWDRYQLDSVFSQRTKLLVLNSPQNPLGKVYNRDELLVLAELCQKYDVVCLSDEVYEWMVLTDSGERLRMATMPGMWDRTITVGSAGKCFNITGWRVGWCVGPAALISHVVTVQSEVVFSVASPLQAAIGRVFRSELNNIKGKDDSCLAKLRSHVKANRDLAVAELSRMGLSCVIPSGGWFMLVPVAPRLLPLLRDTSASKGPASDVSIVELITKKFRLATIPASMFYSEEFRCTVGHGYLRLCLNKRRETLVEGLKLLEAALAAADSLAASSSIIG